MASSILENIKVEEMSCPICLELMTEPVSTYCGHSFCKPYITSNYESMEHEQGVSHCPVCQVPYQFENLRPTCHVANIVERLKELTLSPKADHCDLHEEKLLLFCKEGRKLICWLCEHSQGHCGHNVLHLEQATGISEEKLCETLGKFMTDKKESEKWKAYIKEERTSWKAEKNTL